MYIYLKVHLKAACEWNQDYHTCEGMHVFFYLLELIDRYPHFIQDEKIIL